VRSAIATVVGKMLIMRSLGAGVALRGLFSELSSGRPLLCQVGAASVKIASDDGVSVA
jgi:hypothetical protein